MLALVVEEAAVRRRFGVAAVAPRGAAAGLPSLEHDHAGARPLGEEIVGDAGAAHAGPDDNVVHEGRQLGARPEICDV